MLRKPLGILGIAIDNVDLQEAVLKILNLIEEYPKKRKAHLVATVNLDFLANVYGFRGGAVRHLELLQILRSASLVTADGMPLIWLSRLIQGHSLKKRVTGADLFDPLMQALEAKEKSVFLIGGKDLVLEGTCEYIKKQYPNLKIAGKANPLVITQGWDLEKARKEDRDLLEKIDKAKPDLLLINLGNPKQEIWFKRVQTYLNVPVSIGVGGIFSFVSGHIPRAPLWMQDNGLEWLFRLFLEPTRLWRRYVVDAMKYGAFILSLIPVMVQRKPKVELKIQAPKLFISKHASVVVITLPPLLNGVTVEILALQFQEAAYHTQIIVDFKYVQGIDLEGFGFLLIHWMNKKNLTMYGINMSKKIRRLLKRNRVWDVMVYDVLETVEHMIASFKKEKREQEIFYQSIQQKKSTVVISYLGEIKQKQEYRKELTRLIPTIKYKNGLLDLSYCTFIDNSGFIFLLKLRQVFLEHQKKLQVTGVSENVLHQFYLAGLDPLDW